ncbi:MAG: radical SAM protein [Fervidicoccaceae archaeon]
MENRWLRTRIALVSANRSGGAYEQSFGVNFPPLAAASLAAVAHEQGYEAKLFDASPLHIGNSHLASLILEYDPDISAFIVNSSSSAGSSAEVARMIKKSGQIIVAGGHHATFAYPSLLKKGFDVVFLGEGEISFSRFLSRIKRGEEWRDLVGIAFLDGGKPVATGKAPMVERLDELPMPKFEIFNRDNYKMGIFDPDGSVITIETSRGCPYNCEYCSVTRMWGAKWRLKSFSRVIEELKKVRELGYRWVFFVDDNFIIPLKRAVEEKIRLLQEMIKTGLNSLHYIVQLRADFVAKNNWLPKMLKEAGVKVAFLGIESGDMETLARMRKNLSLDLSTRAVSMLSHSGIIVHGGFILGAPHEGYAAIKRTIDFATSLINYGLDSAQFSIYTPLPGTESFEKALINGDLLTLDWDLYDILHPVMRTKLSPPILFFIQRFAQYYFFLRKGIWSLARGRLFSEPKTEKDKLLHAGTKFLFKNIPKNILGLLALPLSSFTLFLKLRRGMSREEKEELKDIAQAETVLSPTFAVFIKRKKAYSLSGRENDGSRAWRRKRD